VTQEIGPEAPCPISGRASRLLQKVRVAFIDGLWRRLGAPGVRRLYGEQRLVGLYESPNGLVFAYPAIAGDRDFYEPLYARKSAQRMLTHASERRVEYLRAADHIAGAQSVLEAGCGPGHFRRHIPQARYVGVDPYPPADAPPYVTRAFLSEIVRDHPESFDVACAFQVIEHTADPVAMVRDLAGAVRPGGRVIIGAPLHPSTSTAIPNNPLNAPPHHLTWWTAAALTDLCEVTGLEPLSIEALPPSPHQAWIFWLHRLMPFRASEDVFYAYRKDWIAALIAAYALAGPLAAVFGLPKGAEPIDLLLVARKP
jgi:SAM-dependent methyltransferase